MSQVLGACLPMTTRVVLRVENERTAVVVVLLMLSVWPETVFVALPSCDIYTFVLLFQTCWMKTNSQDLVFVYWLPFGFNEDKILFCPRSTDRGVLCAMWVYINLIWRIEMFKCWLVISFLSLFIYHLYFSFLFWGWGVGSEGYLGILLVLGKTSKLLTCADEISAWIHFSCLNKNRNYYYNTANWV